MLLLKPNFKKRHIQNNLYKKSFVDALKTAKTAKLFFSETFMAYGIWWIKISYVAATLTR